MTPPDPVALPPCELCGGRQIGNLAVMGQHHVGIHPAGRTLWMSPLSRLSAVTCLTCGHTKLFAMNLEKIRAEATQNPERFRW
ncbi:hypothetical protein [Nocardia sp. CA-290969]|uniref:hypothetical protein n=1 Tax=Nocardia sp. CA-290969 TaxID=3239986 RepID=UPI003D905789